MTIACYGYYYMRRITTNIFSSRMRLSRWRLHGFINPHPPLRLWGRRLKVNIIFVGMIIALANESVTMNGFTSWSVSVMI